MARRYAEDVGDANAHAAHVIIRSYRSTDLSAALRCVVELQEFERTLDPRLRPGEEMADAYWAQVLSRCESADGRVFVAEEEARVIGLVAVLAAEPFTELDEPPGTYGLVTDLIVSAAYRGRGIGRVLLTHAEAFARAAGAKELRIGVLAANRTARRVYADCGFLPHLEILAKRLANDS